MPENLMKALGALYLKLQSINNSSFSYLHLLYTYVLGYFKYTIKTIFIFKLLQCADTSFIKFQKIQIELLFLAI